MAARLTPIARLFPERRTTTWQQRWMPVPMKADTRIRLRRSFRRRCALAGSGNRGSGFAGEPALATSAIDSGYDVVVGAAPVDQSIFIGRAGNARRQFHETTS